MSAISESMKKKGYAQISGDDKIGVGWQGKQIKDCWMWTRKLNHYEGGVKRIRTAKVSDLKDIALHCYQDGWIPVKPFTDEFIVELENALRAHTGLTGVPQDKFLEIGTIPPEYMGDVDGLKPVDSIPEERATRINATIARRKAAEKEAAHDLV